MPANSILTLSYHTVDADLRNIYSKLGVRSRTGAVAKALRERIMAFALPSQGRRQGYTKRRNLCLRSNMRVTSVKYEQISITSPSTGRLLRSFATLTCGILALVTSLFAGPRLRAAICRLVAAPWTPIQVGGWIFYR
jgi:hypothetical protein